MRKRSWPLLWISNFSHVFWISNGNVGKWSPACSALVLSCLYVCWAMSDKNRKMDGTRGTLICIIQPRRSVGYDRAITTNKGLIWATKGWDSVDEGAEWDEVDQKVSCSNILTQVVLMFAEPTVFVPRILNYFAITSFAISILLQDLLYVISTFRLWNSWWDGCDFWTCYFTWWKMNWKCLAWFEQENCDLSQIEINEVLRFMSDVGT